MENFLGVLEKLIALFKESFPWFKNLKTYQKVLFVFLFVAVAGSIGLTNAIFSGAFTPTITQVMLSDYSLSMTTGDVCNLSATVLYSDNDNTKKDNVCWASSNPAVIQVNEDGELIALSAGSATIIAQASNRKSIVFAECLITVADPLSGYTISIQRTSLENYVYIYVWPENDNITQITLYAQSPSGKVYSPPIDKNNLYHFYTETGVWTLYAELKSQDGVYEATKPEDFIMIEIRDVSPNETDALLAGLPIY